MGTTDGERGMRGRAVGWAAVGWGVKEADTCVMGLIGNKGGDAP